jgi:Na+-translocating ferredoxin:NAD+ oxidoreductase RnfD subunit
LQALNTTKNQTNVPVNDNKLTKYTLIALLILTGVSYLSWGLTSIILVTISITVAVSLDYVLSLILKSKGPANTLSAIVFGQIVGLSYSLANPSSFAFGSYLSSYYEPELLPLTAPMAFVYVAIISAVGMVVFKKLQGLLKRKYVNAAAAAKLVVFLPFLQNVLFAQAHPNSILLAGPVGYYYNSASNNTSLSAAFGWLMEGCFGNIPTRPGFQVEPAQVFQTLTLLKFHGWVGGASALAVILVGIGLFIVARKYVKWRITLSYLATIVLMSLVMFSIYGGDFPLRLGFELFIGSSIFLAFFMAIDPPTTPNQKAGQVIFGFGLGVLTVLIQTYMGFLGGSILALIIMNLTSPLLDRIKFGRQVKEG